MFALWPAGISNHLKLQMTPEPFLFIAVIIYGKKEPHAISFSSSSIAAKEAFCELSAVQQKSFIFDNEDALLKVHWLANDDAHPAGKTTKKDILTSEQHMWNNHLHVHTCQICQGKMENRRLLRQHGCSRACDSWALETRWPWTHLRYIKQWQAIITTKLSLSVSQEVG